VVKDCAVPQWRADLRVSWIERHAIQSRRSSTLQRKELPTDDADPFGRREKGERRRSRRKRKENRD
jgi:hypothetical protein